MQQLVVNVAFNRARKLTVPEIRKSWQETIAEDADEFLFFVSKRVNDSILAQDLLQDAFVKALQSSGGPSDDEKVRAWFYRILRNVIIDAYRKKSSESKELGSYELQADVLLHSEKLSELACDCERFFLKRINPDYAAVLESVNLGEMSMVDYAKRQDMTVGVVKVKRHRARQALKREILKICRCLVDRSIDCACPDLS